MSFNGLKVAWVVRQGSAELVTRVFERADANGDGRLQPAELQAALSALAPSLGAALRLTDTITGSDALAGYSRVRAAARGRACTLSSTPWTAAGTACSKRGGGSGWSSG